MKRLMIVRHGDTFLPDEPPRRIGARTDLPLTPVGEAQAKAIASWLIAGEIRLDVALSGPLSRAARTAGLITSALPHAVPLRQVSWLNEVDYGVDEGRAESAVIERIGADALARWDRSAEPATGWPIDRAAKLVECRSELDRLPAGTTLLVTSNGTARFILLALGIEGATKTLKLRTGAIGEIEITEHAARLCSWNIRPLDRP